MMEFCFLVFILGLVLNILYFLFGDLFVGKFLRFLISKFATATQLSKRIMNNLLTCLCKFNVPYFENTLHKMGLTSESIYFQNKSMMLICDLSQKYPTIFIPHYIFITHITIDVMLSYNS